MLCENQLKVFFFCMYINKMTDDNHLAKIEGESKEDRRRRLNRRNQQRHRVKKKLLKTPNQSNEPLRQHLPKENVDEFVKTIDELKEFIKTKAKVKDLPAINEVMLAMPSKATMIKSVKNCDDLEVNIKKAEHENLELNPNKRVPTDDTIEKNMDVIKAFYRNYSGGDELDCSDFSWLRETDKVLTFIDTFPKYKKETTRNSKRSVIASVLRNLAAYRKEYNIFSALSTDVAKNKISKQIGENKLSKSQAKNYMDWEDIEKKIKNKKNMDPKDKALVSLYTEIPPRRVKDYALMKVIFMADKNVTAQYIRDLDRDFNYLIIDNKGVPEELIFYNYKTKSVFGKQPYKIKGALANALKEYIDYEQEQSELETGEFLFVNKKVKAYGSGFSTFISDTFETVVGKRVSANLLRHSYITYILKKRLSANKKKEIAIQMAHSTTMQSQYEVVDDDEEEEEGGYDEADLDKSFGNAVESKIDKQFNIKNELNAKQADAPENKKDKGKGKGKGGKKAPKPKAKPKAKPKTK